MTTQWWVWLVARLRWVRGEYLVRQEDQQGTTSAESWAASKYHPRKDLGRNNNSALRDAPRRKPWQSCGLFPVATLCFCSTPHTESKWVGPPLLGETHCESVEEIFGHSTEWAYVPSPPRLSEQSPLRPPNTSDLRDVGTFLLGWKYKQFNRRNKDIIQNWRKVERWYIT